MVKYENECVNCGLPCVGSACSYYKVPHYYCDNCHDETNNLHNFDGRQLCDYCLERIVDDMWIDMSLEEKAQLLDEDFSDVEF